MKKVVKTLYKGAAPVRARFLRAAHFAKEDLEIVYEGEKMVIPHKELKTRAAYKIQVKDNFGNPPENLYYYTWNPENDFQADIDWFDNEL